jgi:hypothetical protein
MTSQHPIVPPPELVQQWVAEIWHEGTPVRVSLSDEHIATLAAQWGAEQALEALSRRSTFALDRDRDTIRRALEALPE